MVHLCPLGNTGCVVLHCSAAIDARVCTCGWCVQAQRPHAGLRAVDGWLPGQLAALQPRAPGQPHEAQRCAEPLHRTLQGSTWPVLYHC
jgi:hypothetical protein